MALQATMLRMPPAWMLLTALYWPSLAAPTHTANYTSVHAALPAATMLPPSTVPSSSGDAPPIYWPYAHDGCQTDQLIADPCTISWPWPEWDPAVLSSPPVSTDPLSDFSDSELLWQSAWWKHSVQIWTPSTNADLSTDVNMQIGMYPGPDDDSNLQSELMALEDGFVRDLMSARIDGSSFSQEFRQAKCVMSSADASTASAKPPESHTGRFCQTRDVAGKREALPSSMKQRSRRKFLSSVGSSANGDPSSFDCQNNQRQNPATIEMAAQPFCSAAPVQKRSCCPICGASRASNGKFELALDMFTKFQTNMEKVQLVRECLERYKHHTRGSLTRRSLYVLWSFRAILKCYDTHCQGGAELFQLRHPEFGVRSFHQWHCSGKDVCDHLQMAENRKIRAQRYRVQTARNKALSISKAADEISSGKQKSQKPSLVSDADNCHRCGISGNAPGKFIIPTLKFSKTKSVEDKLQAVRTMYDLYSHHSSRDLTPGSYRWLLSLRHIVICYDLHCGGSLDEFNRRHPKFWVTSFRDTGCSDYRSCNYKEKSEYQKSKISKHNASRKSQCTTKSSSRNSSASF